MLPQLDQQRLLEALALAEGVVGVTEPNPRVGCVIGTADGQVLGRGATQQAGGPHAEVMALRDATARGTSAHGATAWVTLEPCAHHGRTPPCCDALIAAGLARVVVALQDPYPQVAGAGIARMRAAGVRVEMASADIAAAAWELNIGYFSRLLRKRPWVRVKVAASLDGRTALDDGQSQWITGEAARADGHAWRNRASAVLTGIGTVLADDPRLDVRLVPGHGQPLRVVVDSRLRLPPAARLLQAPGRVLIATALPPPGSTAWAPSDRRIEFLNLRDEDSGQVDLPRLLDELARRGVNELHVEGGARLNGSLAQSQLVDEWLVYLAPKLLGSGRGMVALPPPATLHDAVNLRVVETRLVGADIRVRLRPLAPPGSPGPTFAAPA
jgi:diaminohydroxyphosphoribosylaminopyrimidine deaminase/5-amino-6-(5-phosphoribosylamino)uracil reductase